MKKVTIPTCANPFVAFVNGIKYTYPAGETVEVPDDVAAVIEQHNDAHNNPKHEQAIPPFGSGNDGLAFISIEGTINKNLDTLQQEEIGFALTDKQCAMLDNAAATKMPIIVNGRLTVNNVWENGASSKDTEIIVTNVAMFQEMNLGGTNAFVYSFTVAMFTLNIVKAATTNYKWVVIPPDLM